MSNKPHTRKRDPEQVKYSILDDQGIRCTCTEAANRLHIKNYIIRAYIIKHDAETFEDIRSIRSRLEYNRLALAPSRSDRLPFTRSKVCYRNDFRFRCKHYLTMLDLVSCEHEIHLPCKGATDSTMCTNYDGEIVKLQSLRLMDKTVIECNPTKQIPFNKGLGK